MILFGENDPSHFGNLQLALVSLFRAATMDDWTDIMYINMLGCDRWGYEMGRSYGDGTLRAVKENVVNCNNPSAMGWVAAGFMISFEILGALVLLTLFIGIVATSMEEAKHDQKEEQAREKKLEQRASALGIVSKLQLEQFREIFNYLDVKKEGKLDRDSMKPVVKCLPLVHTARRTRESMLSFRESFRERGEGAMDALEDAFEKQEAATNDNPEQGAGMTRHDIDKLICAVDDNYNGFVEFSEFLLLMEFMKRVDADPTILDHFRASYKTVKPPKPKDPSPQEAVQYPTSPASSPSRPAAAAEQNWAAQPTAAGSSPASSSASPVVMLGSQRKAPSAGPGGGASRCFGLREQVYEKALALRGTAAAAGAGSDAEAAALEAILAQLAALAAAPSSSQLSKPAAQSKPPPSSRSSNKVHPEPGIEMEDLEEAL